MARRRARNSWEDCNHTCREPGAAIRLRPGNDCNRTGFGDMVQICEHLDLDSARNNFERQIKIHSEMTRAHRLRVAGNLLYRRAALDHALTRDLTYPKEAF
jgi:hypothetical protein